MWPQVYRTSAYNNFDFKSIFQLCPQAQEKGGQAAMSQVTVVVTDVDDQRPVFSEDEISVTVSEDIGQFLCLSVCQHN